MPGELGWRPGAAGQTPALEGDKRGAPAGKGGAQSAVHGPEPRGLTSSSETRIFCLWLRNQEKVCPLRVGRQGESCPASKRWEPATR